MKNYIQNIRQITVAAPKDVESGELVVVNSLVGVACTSAQKEEIVIRSNNRKTTAEEIQEIIHQLDVISNPALPQIRCFPGLIKN